MVLKDICPVYFGYKFDDYRMLMRSILMKSLYDSKIKSSSRYKGMYKSGHFNECWTIKFGFWEGIYGLMLSQVKDKEAEFILYYFSCRDENLIDKNSLFEAVTALRDDYMQKVRNFSDHKELLANFRIAKIYIKAEESGIFLSVKSKFNDRIYAKDGVCVGGKTIIKKGGIDKNFPSFRLTLAFINFMHIAMSKIYKPDFSRFKIYKKRGEAIYYDFAQNLNGVKDPLCMEIYLNMLYGKSKTKYVLRSKEFEILRGGSCLHKFLINLEKNGKKAELSSLKDRANFFIITGYLGSGKTKFIQNFIEHETAQNRFTGVIQNEIGKIGLDARLLDAKYATVEIDQGCVCCSMSGQIRAGVNELRSKKPDTILLETTGVANPFNLLSELNDIKEVVNLCSVITVVDGANFLSEYQRGKILIEQVKAADVILLNKTDLISRICKEKIRRILIQNNKCAEIFETVNGELNPNFLFYNRSQTSYIASLLIEGKMHATHLDDGIVSFKKDMNDGISREKFIAYLKDISKKFFRIKGLICFKNDARQYVLQFVNGKFDISVFSKQKRCDNFLVFIGRNTGGDFYFPREFLA